MKESTKKWYTLRYDKLQRKAEEAQKTARPRNPFYNDVIMSVHCGRRNMEKSCLEGMKRCLKDARVSFEMAESYESNPSEWILAV